MDYGMPRPAQNIPPREEGFIIIEVLVSAIILALVAGAVLTLITATTRSAANQRNRSVAYDLAQQDQARMRTLRLTLLNGYVETAHPKVDGTEYTVVSHGDYLDNPHGTLTCATAGGNPDYIQLTSTVSDPGVLRTPVVIRSIVSPSDGSIEGGTRGMIVVRVTNAAEKPVEGVEASLSDGKVTRTESEGCATFAELPVSPPNYTLTMKGNGLITPEGLTETTTSVAVAATPASEVKGRWDWPGKLEPEFVYTEPGTGGLRPAPVDSMWISNTGSGAFPPRPYGTPGGTRSAKLLATPLYPFPSKYTVYAGSCESNNPDPKSEGINKLGLASIEVPPKGEVKPRIYVPALELTVEDSTGHPVANATVTVTDSNAACKFGSNPAKRVYKTNLGGHLSSTETGPTEAGLPFGSYNVCASAQISRELWSVKTTTPVEVKNYTGGTVLHLKLAKGGSECA
jgi:type II secretory pathway pseudopilin PulG